MNNRHSSIPVGPKPLVVRQTGTIHLFTFTESLLWNTVNAIVNNYLMYLNFFLNPRVSESTKALQFY